MRRERFYNDLGYNDRPRRGRSDYRGRGEGYYRQDKGRGLHLYGGRRDGLGPHLEEGCNTEERIVPQSSFRNVTYGTSSSNKIL